LGPWCRIQGAHLQQHVLHVTVEVARAAAGNGRGSNALTSSHTLPLLARLQPLPRAARSLAAMRWCDGGSTHEGRGEGGSARVGDGRLKQQRCSCFFFVLLHVWCGGKAEPGSFGEGVNTSFVVGRDPSHWGEFIFCRGACIFRRALVSREGCEGGLGCLVAGVCAWICRSRV